MGQVECSRHDEGPAQRLGHFLKNTVHSSNQKKTNPDVADDLEELPVPDEDIRGCEVWLVGVSKIVRQSGHVGLPRRLEDGLTLGR